MGAFTSWNVFCWSTSFEWKEVGFFSFTLTWNAGQPFEVRRLHKKSARNRSQKTGMGRFISLIFAVIICFSLRPFPRLFLCTGFLYAQGRQFARCRDPPSFFFWQLTSGRQQKKCQQCQPPIKRTGPKPANLFPQSFHQEATTEVQRRAAEWERQIEHLDAKELLKKSSSSRGFFYFLLCFWWKLLGIFDLGVVSVSYVFLFRFCLVLSGLLVH